jgi:hypothetical protein
LTRFAHAVREELWSRGRLIESRLSHGEAFEDEHGIIATDTRDDTLVAAAERELARLRAAIPNDLVARIVAEANTEEVTATMTIRSGPLSIVTTPTHIDEDLRLLRNNAGVTPAGRAAERRLPILWKNGTAAVLLHEALGHPLEYGLAPIELPFWLHADIPLRPRRATFRDVPLLRMQHVHATQTNAPFPLPDERIEIELVDSGGYDPLTDSVTIRVAVPRIELVVQRTNIVFIGAQGDALRYPGVICSREGQELVVGSAAPLLLTELR